MKKNIFILLSILLLFNACQVNKKELLTDQISCSQEQLLQKKDISQYIDNIELSVNQNGCEIISLYHYLIQTKKIDILDNLEKNSILQKELLSLFSEKSVLYPLVSKNENFKDLIIQNSLHNGFIKNFTYLINKKLYKKDISLIEKDNSYLNYFLLSSLYAKDKKETLELYSELTSSISIELLPSFTLIVNSVGKDYSFNELVENFTNLEKELSFDSLKELTSYPQYFAYFLYPKKETFYSGAISSYQLKEIQRNIQQKVIFLYKEMFEQNRYTKGVVQINYALLTIQNIYPYLLEQYSVEVDEFKSLFTHLIKKDYLFSLFEKDKCSDKTKENFAVFGQKNIENMVKLLKKEKEFTYNLFYELREQKNKTISLFYISNLYKNLNEVEWKIFKNLLKTLPDTFANRVYFIQRIEQSGYFRNISIQNDYDVEIESQYSRRDKKYKYILLTPYPLQSDKSLFEMTIYSNISDKVLQESLVDLITKDKNRLEKHEFTKGEQIFGNIEKLNNLSTAISIGLVPFTGGLSLTVVAIKEVVKGGVKQGTKKGVKYFQKKIVKLIKNKLKNGEAKDKLTNIEKLEKVVKITKKATKEISNKKEKVLSFFYSNNLKIKQICKENN